MNRYHGLSKQDAVFFNMSDLICELARTEDCLIMGRCADAILKNNHIPHISIFISAPFQVRTQHVMDVRNMDMKQAVRFLKKMDKQHKNITNFTLERNGENRKIMTFVSTVRIMASRRPLMSSNDC